MPTTFTIEITDEQIERAIARSTTKVYGSDDEDDDEDDDEPREDPMKLATLVNKAVTAAIDKEVAKVTKVVVEAAIKDQVNAALHAGFPTFDEWGTQKGRKTLADMIGERVFKPDRNRSDPLEYLVREQTEKHIKVMVAEAVKKVSVDIDKMFSDAAAEGIATVLKRRLGIS
jgi:flagellar biosynthesis/type III secretory pathway protein FliH